MVGETWNALGKSLMNGSLHHPLIDLLELFYNATLEYLFNDHGRLIFRGKSLFSVMKQKSYVVLCSKVVAK